MKELNYLLLDKDDITKVCGVVSHQELMKEMTYNRLQNMLGESLIYKEKYILIEDDDAEEKKKLCESPRAAYYITRKGKVYMRYHNNGKIKFLKPYSRGRYEVVSIMDREHVLKNLVAKAFIKEYKKGDYVFIKNDDRHKVLKYEVDNLVVIPRKVYAEKTGASARAKKVGLYENGELVRYFSSARRAATELYCSKTTIQDICNGKRKEKMFDVRWL